jgi:hypothetical protein
MTIDEAIDRLQDLRVDWGGTEKLYLADYCDRKLKTKPQIHIDMCPPIGKIIIGYGYNDNSDVELVEDYWD